MLKLTKEKLIKNYLLPNSQTIDLRLIKEPFELDENLILDYNLLISNNSFIKKLPKKLHIKGKLEIANTKIINLPNDLKVLGSLDIRNTKISKLPNGVIVGENLSMRGSLIKTLPEKCSIGDNILMSFGQLTEIPKNAKINGIVKTGFETDNGGLKYIKTIFKQDIDELNRDNEFDDLKFNQIKESFIFCENLTIEDSVDLSRSKISFISDTLNIKDRLIISKNQISLLPNKKIANEVFLRTQKGLINFDAQSQSEKKVNENDLEKRVEFLEKEIKRLSQIIEKI